MLRGVPRLSSQFSIVSAFVSLHCSHTFSFDLSKSMIYHTPLGMNRGMMTAWNKYWSAPMAKRQIVPWSPSTAVTLRAAIDLRERTAMNARIGVENRLRALGQDADNPGQSAQVAHLESLLAVVSKLEDQADKVMADLVKGHPIYGELTAIRGVGDTLAARLIGMIDIERVSTVSALWKWAGLHVVGGMAAKPVKGEKISYNPRLKTSMFLFADVQIKCRGPYREDYDRAKTEYEARFPDRSPMHRHRMAMRIAEKLFLSHLWERWRTAEGLPVSDPYIHTVGGHTNIIRPHERGWKA